MKTLLLAVFAIIQATTLLACNCGATKNQCCDPWELVYEVNSNGGTVSGSRYALLAAIQAGARVRVGWGANLAEADGVYVSGNHAHAELLQSVSKASWKSFQGNAYWYWTLISTTGYKQNVRYNVGSSTNRGETVGSSDSKWYVKSSFWIRHQIYANDKAGTTTTGSLDELKDAVTAGHEVRAVSSKSYGFPLQNIAYDETKVAGQFLDHVSKSGSGQTIRFASNAYWWFTTVSTSGKLDMSRWTVGRHTDRSHTSDTVSTEWFNDPCWELVYAHSSAGGATQGSLSALVLAIQSGKRIRFQFPGQSHYTAEADNLSIVKGHVTAQALKHVSKATLETFQDNAYWYWLMVSTTGTVRATRYNVGAHVSRGNSKNNYAVKWFAEARPWKLALEHNANGGVVHGSRGTVVASVRRGASVRLVQADGAYAFPAQNLAINGDNVAAQTLNSVSMQTAPGSIYEKQITANAYWWFTIVTTGGERDMSRWTVGEHKSRGHTQDRVGLKWFVQE